MSVLRSQKNSRHQGNVGLATAIAWFANNGYLPLIPLTDSQDYDLVVDDGTRLYKVQIKTTYHLNGNGYYMANLRVMGGNRSGTGKVKHFDPRKVDLLFVLTEAGDQYVIPANEVMARSAISLGEAYQQYKVS